MSDKYPMSDVPEGMVHQYIISIRAGRPTHLWTLADETGAIHIHGWHSADIGWGREWMGGVEMHSPKPFDYSSETPDQECCWLLGGPCWHDGTSLYFSERIAPMLDRIDHEAPMPTHIHSYMLSELRHWHRSRFAKPECERCNGEGTIHVEEKPYPNDVSPVTRDEPCPECQS